MHILLLQRLADGEHTFVPGPEADLEHLLPHLLDLRGRELIRLPESRIMRSLTGEVLAVGPCDLTDAGRRALEEDRRLGPRA